MLVDVMFSYSISQHTQHIFINAFIKVRHILMIESQGYADEDPLKSDHQSGRLLHHLATVAPRQTEERYVHAILRTKAMSADGNCLFTLSN